MGTGYVTTAMGESLSFDELIAKASKPLFDKHDHKDKVEKRAAAKPVSINVRGFRPGGASLTPIVPEGVFEVEETEKADPIPKSSFSGGDARSMADLTGIKIEQPKKLKGKTPDPLKASEEELNKVLGGLQAVTKTTQPEEDWRKGA